MFQILAVINILEETRNNFLKLFLKKFENCISKTSSCIAAKSELLIFFFYRKFVNNDFKTKKKNVKMYITH